MSNKLRRTSKGDKAPSVRRNEFHDAIRSIDQKIYQIHTALVENIYITRYASSSITNFIKFLTDKGIVVEEEYKAFVEEQNKKNTLADEIRADENLSREEKIVKAKENDIPEEWVVDPEQPAQAEETAETNANSEKTE